MGLKWEDFTAKGAKDYEIAEAAEKHLIKIRKLAESVGLLDEEILPYGHYVAKIDYAAALKRLGDKPDGKYIDVTAITPTPLGEGKSTTTMGLVQGMGKRGLKVSAAIRQPSGGPTMNIKGSAAGGGMSQCVPLTPFSLGLTGDINAIMNSHNLGMVALNSRMQHERNYDDATLAKRNLKRLDIDPTRVEYGWIIDFAAQCLRNIIIGIGGKQDGYMMQSKFGIAVSSEIMAILDAINPNLMQTLEGQPCFVHAGPFANIAIGQSSIISDRLALKLADYHVTESGFAADIGFEKFWNLKCRFSGLTPNAAVIVATVRALKCHGGAPIPVPGKPLPEEYKVENVGQVEKGCANLLHHVATVKKAGISPVVCINSFVTDTKEEIAAIRKICENAGARVAVSDHWLKGGEGALELADDKPQFKFLYDLNQPLRERINLIATEVYGADGVEYSPDAAKKLEGFEKDPEIAKLGLCMVKTQTGSSSSATAWCTRARALWFRWPGPSPSCPAPPPTRPTAALMWIPRPGRSRVSSKD